MQDERVIEGLKQIGLELGQRPSIKSEVMRQIAQNGAGVSENRRWMIGRLGIALAGIAACAVVLSGLLPLRHVSTAEEAFAEAISDVAKAHTFSCRQIATHIGADGQQQTDWDFLVMFKEPDRERRQYLPVGGALDEILITDYSKHQQLILHPKDKTAALMDITSNYEIDAVTGQLKPEKLNTLVRDDVMRLTAQAVIDKGMTKLNGREVRELQSRDNQETQRTVYVDPRTGLPIQIVLGSQSDKTTRTFASIQIDADIANSLFSLDVPAGYKLFRGGLFKPNPDYDAKMMTKARFLSVRCYQYYSEHGKNFPDTLAALTGPDLSSKALATVLASPDAPDGPPVISYHKPRAGKDWGAEITVYGSAGEQGGVIAAFVDGHAEELTRQQFDALMK